MRVIEKNMLQAINTCKAWKSDNTSVAPIDGVNCAVFLHGNHIANVENGIVRVNRETLAKWPTPTTKSRLRALGANVTTRGGVTYLDGKAV